MGYAPVSRVVDAPGDAGTVLSVEQDAGDRFPLPPFTYLAWPSQTIPNLGVDSEEGQCVSVDGDVFTLVRPPNAVAITSGMQFAAFSIMPNYSIGETVTLSEEFPADDTSPALTIRSPGGAVTTPALTEDAADDGGSAYSLAFAPRESGEWHYVFTTDQRVHPEQDFYVRFSEVF